MNSIKVIHQDGIRREESELLQQTISQSQEMLLQKSVSSSNFLSSPTLSLGLIESKITKKSLNAIEVEKICQGELGKAISRENDQAYKPSFLMSMLTNSNSISANDNKSQIIASYQMEVQYLRKVNFMQSMEIQKLRKLIRVGGKQIEYHQSNQNIVSDNHFEPIQFKQGKISKKKAIDIIKNRQLQQKQLKQQQQQAIVTKTTKKQPSLYKHNSAQSIVDSDQNDIAVKKYQKLNKDKRKDSLQDRKQKKLQQNVTIIKQSKQRNKRGDKESYKKQLSLMDIDVNTTSLTLKHNISTNSQSTCKKIKSRRNSQQLNLSLKKHNNSISLANSAKSKGNKQNVNPKTLSLKIKDHHNNKNRKPIASIDLLNSIKNQLSMI